MEVVTGEYQSTTSANFIAACVLGPVFVISSTVWLALRGRQGNDAFAFAPRPAYPVLVLLWRLTVSVFFLATMGVEFSTNNQADVWDLVYFTNWNLIVLALYFVVATCASAVALASPRHVPEVQGRRAAAGSTSTVEKFFTHERSADVHVRSGCVQALFLTEQLLGELEVPTSILVSMIIWFYVAPDRGYDNYLGFTSVASHLCNAVVMVIDFMFAAGYLINGAHFALLVLWPSLYLCWHLAGNAAYGVVAYNFMRTDDDAFIGYMFGLLFICLLIFAFTHGLSRLKQACFKRYSDRARVPSTAGGDDDDDDATASPSPRGGSRDHGSGDHDDRNEAVNLV